MGIVEIASVVVTILASYLIEGGKEIAKGATKELWTGVKNLFTSDKDKKLIENLESNPNNPEAKKEVEGILEKFGWEFEDLGRR